jgi:voltage-gated potassium channel
MTEIPIDSGHTSHEVSRLKLRVHNLLSGRESDLPSRVVAVGLATLIILNVAAASLQTVELLHLRWGRWFDAFETLSMCVFTIEYITRIWACTASAGLLSPVLGRVRYALTFLMLIDLLAIAPFFVTSILPVDLRMLRLVRLVRLMRVIKVARYSESLQLLGRVFVARRNELFVTLIALGILLVVASTLMYHVEHDAQPNTFSSIPATMWWSVETLTTIGYGDMLPVTVPGKILNSIIAILGIGLFALPAGILGSGFVEELQRRKGPGSCPHCGGTLRG